VDRSKLKKINTQISNQKYKEMHFLVMFKGSVLILFCLGKRP
jgi:hypothetical protein